MNEPVVVERWLPVPPERVWAYFTDSALWARWQGTEASIDARPGGELAIRMGSTGEAGARGTFVTLDPPGRLVFTWGWVDAPFGDVPRGSTTVEIELRPERGGTLLRLTHRDLPPTLEPLHRQGWTVYLERLAIVTAGGSPGPDPSLTTAPRSEAT